ncbi:MAG: hypothetical protein HC897_17080, partial [Thermoanaerobaculia bacterium]|nr:hypothetical protein [Thermoanaerobaculia bacterium]
IVLAEPTQARTGFDFELVPLAPAGCGFRGLCLAAERFEVEVSWRDFSGFGERAGAEALTDDAGYFWFLDDENVEMVAKVVDACAGPNPGFWFFAAGLTNFEVETKVTDLLTGEVKTYRNPLGQPFQPILDTNAFSFCTAAAAPRAAERPEPEPRLPKLFESCEEDGHALCLNDGRFQVEAFYETFLGETGMAHAVSLTEDAGYFWFFDDDNVEVVVKVLDGCFAAEPRFWVFAAGLTNVEVLLRVTDTETGAVKEYRNPLATPFQPILDTGAFATCP